MGRLRIDMTPERWQKISHLYNAALARDAKERAALLDRACGGDSTLRSEVESLLAQGSATEAFMAEPALEVAAAGEVSRASIACRRDTHKPAGADRRGEAWRS